MYVNHTNNKNVDELKYAVNLYKRYGEKPFLNREQNVYRRDTKLLAISRIKNGESLNNLGFLHSPSSLWILD